MKTWYIDAFWDSESRDAVRFKKIVMLIFRNFLNVFYLHIFFLRKWHHVGSLSVARGGGFRIFF